MTHHQQTDRDPSPELKILSRGIGWAGLWNIVGQAVALVAAVLITRLVGAEVFGAVAVGVSLLTVIQVGATLGMDRGVLRYVSFSLGHGRTHVITRVVGYASGLTVAIALAFAGLYLTGLRPWVVQLLPRLVGAEFVVTVVVLTAPLLALLPLLMNALIGLQRPAAAQIGNGIVRPLAQLLVLLLMLRWMSSLEALTFATVAAYLLAVTFLAVAFTQSVGRIPDHPGGSVPPADAVTLADFIRFSAPLALIPALNLAGQQLDILIVGHFMDGTDTGVYAIVRRLSTLVMLPLLVAGGVTAATISKLFAQADLQSISRIYAFATKWVYLGSAVIFVVLFIEAEDLLALFGSSFPIGAGALRIVAVGQLLNAAVGPSGNSLLMVGHHRLLLVNSVLSAVTGVTLALTLVPRFGLVGAGIAVACTLALVNALSSIQLAMKLRVTPGAALHWIKRIAVLAAGLGLGAAAASVMPWAIGRIAIVAVVSCTAVLGVGLLWEGLSVDDRAVVDTWRRRQ